MTLDIDHVGDVNEMVDRPGLTTMGEASPGSCPGATPDNWRAKLEKRIAASRKGARSRKRMAKARRTIPREKPKN